MPVPQRPIILDASCLLNLYASRKLREIAVTSPQPFVVAEYVVQQEALYIRRRASAQEPEEREPVEIGPLVTTGLIQVITLNSEAEAITFIDLASEMDDGEAMTCALAMHRAMRCRDGRPKSAASLIWACASCTHHLNACHSEAVG